MKQMSIFFSFMCSIITLLMCCLHVLLLLGVPIGEYVLGGEDRVIPKKRRYINLISVCAFFFLGLFYLGKAEIISFRISNSFSNGIMIMYTLFLTFAIIGNIFFTKSRKEKIVMIPASVVGFVCSFFTLVIGKC